MKWLILVCMSVLLTFQGFYSDASSIELIGEPSNSSYWAREDPAGNQVIKTPKDIALWNQEAEQKGVGLVNLEKYPLKVSRDKVIRDMESLKPAPSVLYKNGKTVTDAEWKRAYQNMNEGALPAVVSPRYGVTTKRVNLRLLPVKEGWFEGPNDVHYDDLQGTALDPAEGVVILSEDKTGNFYFLQASNYLGWAAKDGIALASREEFLHFQGDHPFMMAAEPLVRLSAQGHDYVFQMGAKIPIVKENRKTKELLLPVWNQGKLKEISCTIANETPGLHKGYVPYTRNNLIRYAFKFLGHVYGWGGLENSVDCSSFVNDVFRVTGLRLPRDADQQEKLIADVSFYGKNRRDRYQLISQAKAGELLFSGDHVMMKIGNLPNGDPIVIHALSSYYTFDQGRQKHYIRHVVVTDLSFLNGNHKWMMDNLTSMGFVQ